MKNVKVIGYRLWVIGMLLVSMPTMAQQLEWQSTSSMQTSGSAYTPQVTAVGATEVSSMATTTESYSPAKAPGMRKGFDIGGDTQPGPSPIGDALIPLMLCACAYFIIRARKRANKGERANG